MWGLPILLNLLSKIPNLLIGPVTQFFTGININQVLTNVIDGIKLAIQHWKISLIVLLAVSNIITGYELKHDHSSLLKERQSHALDVANFKDAQAKANLAAKQEHDQVIKESEIKANEAHKAYNDLISQFNANLLRYKANQSGTGTASNKADNSTGDTTKGTNGPGAGTDLPPSVNGGLVITLDDANICKVNTARLKVAHDWALSIQGKTPDATN